MTVTERKHFEVRSAWNARFFRSDRPWAAIQISSGADHPELSDENRVGLVRLVFEDTWEAETDESFNAAMAREILDFVEAMWNRVEAFLIHCEAGMSRSPAVAAALSRIHYNDDGRWFEMYFPNPLVYRLLLDVAARADSNSGLQGPVRPHNAVARGLADQLAEMAARRSRRPSTLLERLWRPPGCP